MWQPKEGLLYMQKLLTGNPGHGLLTVMKYVLIASVHLVSMAARQLDQNTHMDMK